MNLQEVELGGGLLELPSRLSVAQINSNYYYSYYSLFESFEYSTSSLSTLPSLTKLRIADSENTLSMTTFVNEEERNTGYFSNLPIKELYIGRDLKCGMDPFNGTAIEKVEFGGKQVYDIGPLPSLKTLVLGENIERISKYLSCPFTDIYIKTNVPPTVSGSFANKTYLYANLYVPIGSMEAYQNAEVWKNFWNIKEWDPSSDATSISSIKDNAGMEIFVEGMSIRIESADNSVPIRVYNASGSLVYQGIERVISVNNAGLYIVLAGEQTKKVMVQ